VLPEHLQGTSIILCSCENLQCSVICKLMPVRATISAPLAMFCVRSVRYYAFPYVLLALKFPRDRIPGVSIFTTDHYKKLQKITVFLDRNSLPWRSVFRRSPCQLTERQAQSGDPSLQICISHCSTLPALLHPCGDWKFQYFSRLSPVRHTIFRVGSSLSTKRKSPTSW
jgi:hypothetical protein